MLAPSTEAQLSQLEEKTVSFKVKKKKKHNLKQNRGFFQNDIDSSYCLLLVLMFSSVGKRAQRHGSLEISRLLKLPFELDKHPRMSREDAA